MLLLILLTMLSLATGAPKSAIYVDDRAQNYLMKFGYLPQSDLETGNLRDEHQLKEAIKKLQRYGGIPATGEIDAATKKLMTARRCGLPDEPDPRYEKTRKRRFKRFTIHGQQWHHLNLTWSLRTNGGLETGRVRRELGRALDLWARNSRLTFQEINSDNADILISFHKGYHGDGYPFDGKGQILAHAFFPGKDRGGDAHFDEEESWLLQHNSNDEEEGTSLFAVAAHEFGHSLGLAHSSVRGALMYPWYQGLSPNYELPEDDRHGIQQMYGAQEGKLWGIIPGVSSPTTPATRTVSSTASTPTTYRPWRTRPTRPNHYPEDRPRTSPSPRYPSRTGRPDYHPQRPNYWPHQPHKPHRHHTTSTTTTTTTTLAPTTHRTRHHWTPTTRDDVPDKCDTTYDAISVIRREIFIFKGRYLWRIGDRGLYEGYPAEIIRLFNLPKIIDHVDAVYERPDKKIVFFIGKLYYVFNANKLEPGYPKPLWTLGLPKSLEKIDGAMVWGHNGRTYFFSGTMYWRFDESINYVELDYPRDMSMFAGVGYYIDAVFQWNNGKTYFFKDKGFWEFDDMRMKVAHEKPKQSASFWMGCPKEEDTNDIDAEIPKKFYPAVTYSSSKRKDATSIIIVVTIFSALLSYNLGNV